MIPALFGWTVAALLGACTDTAGDPAHGSAEETEAVAGGDSGSIAGLTSLTLSQGVLRPTFDPAKRHYTVEASSLFDATTTVSAMAGADAEVEITHASMDGVPIDSSLSPLATALVEAERIDVQVTEDGEHQAYSILALPETFPDLDVRVASAEAADAYVFLGGYPLSAALADVPLTKLIVDRTGTPAWFRSTTAPVFDFKPSPDGRLTFVTIPEASTQFTGFVLDASYAPVRTLTAVDADLDFREFRILPDGNILLLGTALRDADLTKYGSPPGCCSVLDFRVQEIDPDGAVVFEWDAGDHRSELIGDLPDQRLENLKDHLDYAHVNSVDVDPGDGNWIVGARYLSTVLKVARHETTWKGVTYAPGAILWRLGGRLSDFEIVGDDRAGGWKGFAEQHNARSPEPGRILVYDNASWPDIGATGDSRYVEYVLDEAAMTATKVGAYGIEGAGPTGILGSAERLSDGSTLIGWGSLVDDFPDAPTFTEVSAAGEVLLEVALPPGFVSYRAGVGVLDPEQYFWRSP
jgi:hypothetical protein